MDFTGSSHPTTWFRDRYKEGSLIIKPPYQRKPVWGARQKCYLVESILLSLPIPEIYIQQETSPEGATTFAVVDGQQRIRTVLQFIGSEIDPEEQEQNKFALEKLDATSTWKNKTFEELSDAERARYYDYAFEVRYLKNASDDEVRDMFRRLNKFLSPLKPQELRNATYMGPFVTLTLDLADDDYWVENRIVTPADIRRMTDVEYVSQLLIGVLHGPQGGSAKSIDDYYEQYEDFDDEFPEQRRAEQLFIQALDAIKLIFPEIRGTRWSNKTDFYSLFVALASLLRKASPAKTKMPALRKELEAFADEVDERLANEKAKAEEDVIRYVRAVEKGANDKRRRAERHAVVTELLKAFMKQAKTEPH